MLVECLMYLYHPQFTSVERIVREQELGAVKTLTCKFGIPFLEKPGFRFDPALCGGAFWDVGYYPVSTVLALFPDEDIEVHVAQLYGRKGYSVDFDGMALLRSSEGATISLQWSIGSSYRNELDIWAEQGSVFTDKIYSKSANYSPVLQFRNLNGTESSVAVEETEQFAEMFVCFSEILSNNTMRRLELDRIEKRASLMEKILNHANANRVDLDQSINEQTQY